jgi:hypothetical protein
MAPTYSQAAARLARARGEFAELRAANLDGLSSDRDVELAVDLRAEITVLAGHLARLDRYADLLARCSGHGV